MIPLGTGNDLARAFGWGPGFGPGDAKKLGSVFLQILNGTPVELDRWTMTIAEKNPVTGQYSFPSF